MVVVERPNIVVTTLVRAGMIRVPERHRAWLARELLVQAARRRTAIAGLLPSALVFTAMWPLLDSFGSHRGPPAWMWLSVPVASVVLGVLGFGYDRQARYLRTRNRLATEEPGGASASVTGRRRGG